MLTREDKILGELLVHRGKLSRTVLDELERARTASDVEMSFAEQIIRRGIVPPEECTSAEREARALNAALDFEVPSDRRIGEFSLIREIGRGAMGVVFEAEQTNLDRRVALKLLPSGLAADRLRSQRFEREARVVARLRHPNIVPVYTYGREGGVLFFAMELIEGRTLQAMIADAPLAADSAARIAEQIARALQHAHALGLVHRDVKPGNILIDEDDDTDHPTPRARLSDFGLVHEREGESITLTAAVLGTPAYAAPEQTRGEIADVRQDVYGLGAVLYAMLAGRPPYGESSASLIAARVLSHAPDRLRDVAPDAPAGLVAICERAMARDPRERYASAREMGDDLVRFLAGEPVRARARPRSIGARRFAVFSAAALVAALGVAALIHGLGVTPWVARAPIRPGPTSNARPIRMIASTSLPFSTYSVTPDGSRLFVAADGHVHEWSAEAGRFVRIRRGSCPSPSPDGTRLAWVIGDRRNGTET